MENKLKKRMHDAMLVVTACSMMALPSTTNAKDVTWIKQDKISMKIMKTAENKQASSATKSTEPKRIMLNSLFGGKIVTSEKIINKVAPGVQIVKETEATRRNAIQERFNAALMSGGSDMSGDACHSRIIGYEKQLQKIDNPPVIAEQKKITLEETIIKLKKNSKETMNRFKEHRNSVLDTKPKHTAEEVVKKIKNENKTFLFHKKAGTLVKTAKTGTVESWVKKKNLKTPLGQVLSEDSRGEKKVTSSLKNLFGTKFQKATVNSARTKIPTAWDAGIEKLGKNIKIKIGANSKGIEEAELVIKEYRSDQLIIKDVNNNVHINMPIGEKSGTYPIHITNEKYPTGDLRRNYRLFAMEATDSATTEMKTSRTTTVKGAVGSSMFVDSTLVVIGGAMTGSEVGERVGNGNKFVTSAGMVGGAAGGLSGMYTGALLGAQIGTVCGPAALTCMAATSVVGAVVGTVVGAESVSYAANAIKDPATNALKNVKNDLETVYKNVEKKTEKAVHNTSENVKKTREHVKEQFDQTVKNVERTVQHIEQKVEHAVEQVGNTVKGAVKNVIDAVSAWFK